MKPSFIPFAAFVFLGLVSCHKIRESKTSPLSVMSYSFSGETEITRPKLNDDSFVVKAIPYEYENSGPDLNIVDVLWDSARMGELKKGASAEEAFAFERMMERNRPLLGQVEEYRARLIEGGLSERDLSVVVLSEYVKDVPTITADGVLFGQPAGADLSDWFVFGDYNIVEVDGMDYKMTERAGIRDQYQTPAEFFTTDKMLPFAIRVSTVGLPEEVTFDLLPEIRYVGDDVITVTISIPVRFERYWDWCKKLYSNPDALEQFVSGKVTIRIPFIKKP